MKHVKLLIIFGFLFHHVPAQDITNLDFDQVGNNIHIYYNLTEIKKGQDISIEVFYSTNNGKNWNGPLKQIEGAIDDKIKAGKNNTIVWNVLEEVGNLTGNLKFKLETTTTSGNYIGESGIFEDKRDGKTYKWIRVENFIWMSDNLNYHTEEGSWCVNTDCKEGGRYYNFQTALRACPDGWHLPSNTEWEILEKNLLKKKIYTANPDKMGHVVYEKGDQTYDFVTSFQGYKDYDYNTIKLKNQAMVFWTSNIFHKKNKAANKVISKHSEKIITSSDKIRNGLNVRCITVE